MSPPHMDGGVFSVLQSFQPQKLAVVECGEQPDSPQSAETVAATSDVAVNGVSERQQQCDEFTEEERAVAVELASLGGIPHAAPHSSTPSKSGRAIAAAAGRSETGTDMRSQIDALLYKLQEHGLSPTKALAVVRQCLHQQAAGNTNAFAAVAAALAAAGPPAQGNQQQGRRGSSSPVSSATHQSSPSSPQRSNPTASRPGPLVEAPGTPDNSGAASSDRFPAGAGAPAGLPNLDLLAGAHAAAAAGWVRSLSSSDSGSLVGAPGMEATSSGMLAGQARSSPAPSNHPLALLMHKLQAFGQALGQPSSSQAPAPAPVAAPAPAADPAAKRRRLDQDPSALLAAASRVLEVSSALARAPRTEPEAVVLSDDVVGLLLQRGLSAAIEHAAATKAQSMLQEAAAAMASEAVLAAAQRAVAPAAGLEPRAPSAGLEDMRRAAGFPFGGRLPGMPPGAGPMGRPMGLPPLGAEYYMAGPLKGMPPHPAHAKPLPPRGPAHLPPRSAAGGPAPPVFRARPSSADGFGLQQHLSGARPVAAAPPAGAPVDLSKRSSKSVHHRVARFPFELQEACRRVWEMEGRVRVVCNGVPGELSVLDGRCMVVYQVEGLRLMRNVADYLRAAEEWRIKKWRRHVKVPDFMRPFGKTQEPLTVEEFLCIVGFQPETGKAAGGKRSAAAADLDNSEELSC